jgi:rfaE bifunctional protein nucleotidyltransferase chain/domain
MDKRIIVFTNGCFDLFHAGHVKVLCEAKRLGDKLYVGLNSDKSVRSIKRSDRPIIPQDQRFEIVAACKYVDKVFFFDEETPIKLIETIMPDIIVKGGDYNPLDVVGAHLAKVVIVPLLPDISTSKIIQTIIKTKEI